VDVICRLRYGYLRLALPGHIKGRLALAPMGAPPGCKDEQLLGGQTLNGCTNSPAGFAKEYPIAFCIPARHDYTRHHVGLQDCGMTPLS